jgi:hypothetical protein
MGIRKTWCVVVLAFAACNSAKKQDLADFAAARTSYADAKAALAAGDIRRAHEAYSQSETLLIRIRARSSRPMEETLEAGRVIDGLSAQAWQDLWKSEFRRAVADAFDDLHDRSVAGTLDWLDVRSFFTTYGDNELDQRWQDAVKDVDRAHGARNPDRYVWACTAFIDGYCDTLREWVAAHAARPLATEGFLTGESRNAQLGLIEVRADTTGEVKYELAGGPTGGTEHSAALPTRLVVTVEVTTRRGHSSWDGHRELVVDLQGPAAFSASEEDEAWRKQVDALKALMAPKLNALGQQTLE